MNMDKPYKAKLVSVVNWYDCNSRLVWKEDPYLRQDRIHESPCLTHTDRGFKGTVPVRLGSSDRLDLGQMGDEQPSGPGSPFQRTPRAGMTCLRGGKWHPVASVKRPNASSFMATKNVKREKDGKPGTAIGNPVHCCAMLRSGKEWHRLVQDTMNCRARRAVLVEVWTFITGQAETAALSNHGNCPEGVLVGSATLDRVDLGERVPYC